MTLGVTKNGIPKILGLRISTAIQGSQGPINSSFHSTISFKNTSSLFVECSRILDVFLMV